MLLNNKTFQRSLRCAGEKVLKRRLSTYFFVSHGCFDLRIDTGMQFPRMPIRVTMEEICDGLDDPRRLKKFIRKALQK